MEYLLFIQISIVAGASAAFVRYSSAILIIPILILVWNVEPAAALSAGLITDVFFLLFRLYPQIIKKTIDYPLSSKLSVTAVPAAVLGAWVACLIPGNLLNILLGTGLVAVAFSYLNMISRKKIEELDQLISNKYGASLYETQITKSDGHYFRYSASHLIKARLLFVLGGFFTGMLSLNLGKYGKYVLLRKSEVSSEVSASVATLIHLTIAVVAAITCIFMLYHSESTINFDIFTIVLYAVPGAVLGRHLSLKVSTKTFFLYTNRMVPALLVVLAILLFGKVITS
jgi:uncharacterized membrane protein YfcA